MEDNKNAWWSRQIVAADIYDCFSLKAASKTGYEAVYLSADAVAECVCGLPDTEQMSAEELLWAAKRVFAFSEVPVIADIRIGLGNSTESAARLAGRMAKAGAKAVWINDVLSDKEERMIKSEEWKRRVWKVHEAIAMYPCILICTTGTRTQGMEHAMERCSQAASCGADIVGIEGMDLAEEARRLSEAVKAPKVWTEWNADHVTVQELEDLGFSLVMDCHSVKGALEGMQLFGERTMADGNTVYHDEHDYDGMLPTRSYYDLFEFYKEWIPLERGFMETAGKVVKG
ncbi:MAG: isocitrate lyase/phosphoenolpyruvate mutase family protein [Lachnospiraceae bacterium]|nr:isocitrate lyase/phosphoenolpyruvate mutase family protein [Lachnospiraceae bacterium]